MTLYIEDLKLRTKEYRQRILCALTPDKNNAKIPKSIFIYEPVIWQEDDGTWHTLLGSLPDECIWTMGTTPLESMQEFDKELKLCLKSNGVIETISEEERKEIHKRVLHKIESRNLKLTPEEFSDLDNQEQYEAILQGVQIAERVENKQHIILYQLYDLYVEVYCDTKYPLIRKLFAFTALEYLNAYLEKISLQELFE